MVFDLNLPLPSVLLFAAAFISLAYILSIYARKLWLVRRCKNMADAAFALSEPDDSPAILPHTSVVVYSMSDSDMLQLTLPKILEQDFPGVFEVIVVNEGNDADTDTVVTRLKAKYPNLYLTFTPDKSRVLSRKKLALTLGVKAAKGDVVVITDGTTEVASDKWLRHMVSPLSDRVNEVVLGTCHQRMPSGHWIGKRRAVFDDAADQVAWLSSALSGTPYRGCGCNIAYRRDLFFKVKGFSTSLNLRHGDDDLFVRDIANPTNTVVVLSDSTIGTTGYETSVRKNMHTQRLTHAFTGKRLPKGSRRGMAAGEWLMWVVLAASIAGAWLAGTTNWVGWIAAGVLVLAMMVSVSVLWRLTIKALGYGNMLLSLPWLAATRPLRNIMVSAACSRRKVGNFTWQ